MDAWMQKRINNVCSVVVCVLLLEAFNPAPLTQKPGPEERQEGETYPGADNPWSDAARSQSEAPLEERGVGGGAKPGEGSARERWFVREERTLCLVCGGFCLGEDKTV
uniref:Secreted protein n=1 Tax=Knipowitschia caucasica TaxID=637954 RepID=A0AAV2JA01_KNICA